MWQRPVGDGDGEIPKYSVLIDAVMRTTRLCGSSVPCPRIDRKGLLLAYRRNDLAIAFPPQNRIVLCPPLIIPSTKSNRRDMHRTEGSLEVLVGRGGAIPFPRRPPPPIGLATLGDLPPSTLHLLSYHHRHYLFLVMHRATSLRL